MNKKMLIYNKFEEFQSNRNCFYCNEPQKSQLFKCRHCGMNFCGNHRLPENHDCINFQSYHLTPIGSQKYCKIIENAKNKEIILTQHSKTLLNKDIQNILFQTIELIAKIPRPGLIIKYIEENNQNFNELDKEKQSKIEYIKAKAFKNLGMITKALISCEKVISLNPNLKHIIKKEFKEEYQDFDEKKIIEDDINYLKCPHCESKTPFRNRFFEPEPEDIRNPTPKYMHSTKYHEIVENHYSKSIEKTDFVFHEFVSQFFHLDINVYHPNPDLKRNFFILTTVGMGSVKMNTPLELYNNGDRIELMILLPSDWPLACSCPTCNKKFKTQKNRRSGDMSEPKFYWPLGNLKFLARYPFIANIFIGEGHTFAFEEPLEYMSKYTQYFGWLIKKPHTPGIKIHDLILQNGSKVKFYLLIPLYKHEMEYKLNFGLAALEDKIHRIPDSEIISNSRLPFII